jgi:hypothetical protein
MNLQTSTCRLIILAGLFYGIAAQAQTMYRCGSTYQDRPCENGQQGKIIGTNRAASASDKPKLDASCVRRGEEAKKIIWSREGGAIQQELLAATPSAERRKLISEVYAIRANSSEVRAKIESDCMDERLAERQFGYPGSANAAVSPDTKRKAMTTGDGETKGTENDQHTNASTERKQAMCNMLKQQLSSNSNQQRAGADGENRDQLNQQRRDTDNALKSAGCEEVKKSIQMR